MVIVPCVTGQETNSSRLIAYIGPAIQAELNVAGGRYINSPTHELSALHSLHHPPSMLSISSAGGVLLAVAASLIFLRRRRRNTRLPYPPGPKGYPVIGNVLDIPQDIPLWKAAMSMAGKYSEWLAFAVRVCGLTPVYVDSDVLYLNMLGADHIILNSSEAISDLLDKRSAIYSGRVRGFWIHCSSVF
jgi:hypothetical protein